MASPTTTAGRVLSLRRKMGLSREKTMDEINHFWLLVNAKKTGLPLCLRPFKNEQAGIKAGR
jgi:hypothetical protein